MKRFRQNLLLALVNTAAYLRHPSMVWKFRRRLPYWPNIASPVSYHKKMLWSKIFEHNPKITRLSDKIEAKNYVEKTFPQVLVAQLKWTGKTAADIPDTVLTQTGILKPNHGSGWILRLPKAHSEKVELVKTADHWLSLAYGRNKGEWGYHNIDRRLLIEEEIKLPANEPLIDYKFYTAGGRVIFIWVGERSQDFNAFRAWVLNRDDVDQRTVTMCGLAKEVCIPHSGVLDLVKVTEAMAEQFQQVRVDFTLAQGKFYFTEFTFYSRGGFDFLPEGQNPLLQTVGDEWDLSKSWFAAHTHRGLWGAYAKILRDKAD